MIAEVSLAHGVREDSLSPALAELPGDGRVPLDRLYSLLEVAAEGFEEPDDLPLLVIRDATPEAYEALGLMVSTAETLGAALRAVVKFGRLVTDEPVGLSVEGDQVRLTYLPEGPRRPGHRYAAMLMLADAIGGLSRLAGEPIEASRAVLPGGRPSEKLRALLGTDAIHDGWPPSLDLHRSLLERPIPTANPPVYAYFEGLADAALAAHERPLEDRVREQLLRRLPHGTATVEGVARDLGMSTRSLQRALRASSLSFTSLLEQVRREGATTHLDEGRTVTEVALLLGYSDARALRRAYRRWHGRSPGEAG
jgi:AraC-like DNA-binding protein